MANYITKIKVNKVFHLENFEINLSESEKKHLIITGRNGSGKTILLKAMVEFLRNLANDQSLTQLGFVKQLDKWKNQLAQISESENPQEYLKRKNMGKHYEGQLKQYFGKVEITFDNIHQLVQAYQNNDLLLAYYEAFRKPTMIEPKNPTKPTINHQQDIDKNATDQFLYFLSDLKIQEALARNESLIADADKIKAWFTEFENILKQIFSDNDLNLVFNYKDYSFLIRSMGKEFKFTELSDGYASVIEIISDLILKMQKQGSVSQIYNKDGIVLIDEVETHLHLELQRVILPMLTRIFPNIQFIVTTHSPFILNSLDNAVAYDLQNRESIDDLTEYSYQALAEGYFGVKTESSYMEMKLDRYKALCEKSKLSTSEELELGELYKELSAIPNAVAPALVNEFKSITLKYK